MANYTVTERLEEAIISINYLLNEYLPPCFSSLYYFILKTWWIKILKKDALDSIKQLIKKNNLHRIRVLY